MLLSDIKEGSHRCKSYSVLSIYVQQDGSGYALKSGSSASRTTTSPIPCLIPADVEVGELS